jgi:hypothetical protein
MPFRWTLVLASLLATVTPVRSARAESTVVVGPGYERDQKPERAIRYRAPKGWIEDVAAAREHGIHAVLVPAGKTLRSTDAAISVAYQRKNADKPGLRTLEAFFRVDAQNMLAQFPGIEFGRWQPRGLDPASVPFMSLEMWGKGVSPQRIVYLDAGDGYYSVTLTVETRDALSAPSFERFFESLTLR